jgi:hypothetical protein
MDAHTSNARCQGDNFDIRVHQNVLVATHAREGFAHLDELAQGLSALTMRRVTRYATRVEQCKC